MFEPSRVVALLWPLCAAVVFTQCETMESSGPNTVHVTDRLFYPDGQDLTYVVLPGAEIVGAGGVNCTFIVEAGGRLEAHAGSGNTYRIKNGGIFKGFLHPAENCVVEFAPGAEIESINGGPGTRFVPLP